MDDKILDILKTKIEPDISDSQRRLMELMNGAEPQNESERKMVEEINQAREIGRAHV